MSTVIQTPPDAPGAVQVKLSWSEFLTAAFIGAHRHAWDTWLGKVNRHGADGSWDLHIEGACAEAAAGHVTGFYWPMECNFDKRREPDLSHNTEVRLSRSRRDLIIRPGDPLDRRFVCVTGRAPRFVVQGWIRGADATRDEWQDDPGGRDPAWFVPLDALHPLSTLTP